jgi:hypothetical protein
VLGNHSRADGTAHQHADVGRPGKAVIGPATPFQPRGQRTEAGHRVAAARVAEQLVEPKADGQPEGAGGSATSG